MQRNSYDHSLPSFWTRFVKTCLIFLFLVSLGMFVTTPLHAQTAHLSWSQSTIGSGFHNPWGVAVDQSGNVYISSTGDNTVSEIPLGCVTAGCVKTLGGGFNYPQGVAVDGNGNVFVADTHTGAVKEIPPGCITASCVETLLPGYFSAPGGITTDGSGNVYVADQGNSAVNEIPVGCTVAGCVKTLGGGFNSPNDVVVDGSGNVYVSDEGSNSVKKIPVGCATSSCVKILGGGIGIPFGVGVDGSGNVYVADNTLNAVREIPVGCTSSSCVLTLDTASAPSAIRVDASQNLFFASYTDGSVVELGAASAEDVGTIALGKTSIVNSLTFTFDTGGTIGNPVALTQGAAGLDFAVVGGTCAAGTYNTGATCTVNVTFTPKFAGLRMGAVVLKDGSGNTIATAYIHGIGSGPQVAFGPGVQSAVGSGLTSPWGVAVDGSGNVYIADQMNNRVLKAPASDPTCSTASDCTTVGSGLNYPTGVAVDGSGNVYIVDEYNHRVLKVPASDPTCSTASDCTTVGSGLNYPTGVAVDGSGNVYIADDGHNRVLKVPASDLTCATASDCTPVGGVLHDPYGVAVDGSGNVYIADSGNSRVLKVPASDPTCATASDCTPVGSGLSYPTNVAVDGGGKVYIVDYHNRQVVKVPWTGSGYGTQSTVDSGLLHPTGVAVDSSGNVYIVDQDQKQAVRLDLANAPSLSFPTTNVGDVSPAQDVVVQNIGNAPLNISLISTAANFTLQGPDTSCASNGQQVDVGLSCTLGIEFAPQASGANSGSVILTDDALNTPQTINLSGTGIGSIPTVTSVSPASGPISGGTSVTITGTNFTGATRVNFGIVAATNVTVVSATAITATSPTATGIVDVTVTTPGGTSATSSADQFTFAAVVTKLSISAASPQTAGEPFVFTVTAQDASSNTVTGYSGTVAITSSDSAATLPPSVTLSNGVGNFSITLNTPGSQTITATDTVTSTIRGTATVQAIAAGQLTFVGIQSGTGLCTNGACVAPVVNIGDSSSGYTAVFEVPAGLTIGSFNYVDQGIAGATSEYNALTPDANPNACKTGLYATTTTCNADYVFSPSYPGSRYGALQVLGNSGNVLATVYLGGTGVGPKLAFSPAVQTTVGTALNRPQGVFVDGFGNVYIANTTGDSIIKVTSAGVQSTIPITGLTPATLSNPGGLAVDGVGNVYIADYSNSRVVKAPWNGSSYGTATTIGSSLSVPNDVAVDGNGNVYIANEGYHTIVKVPWNGTAYGTQVTVPTPTFSGNSPTGVAVDGNLNVYVADWAGGTVQKIPWTGVAYGTAVPLGSGLNKPFNVSVDANSNVYIADSGNDRVVVESWTGSAYGAQTVVANYANNGLSSPTGVSVDGNGNVYIADQSNSRILKLGNSTGASLTFATPTRVGSVDTTDGPLSFTMVNVGNAPLTISVPGSGTNPAFPSGFSFDSSSSCPNVLAGGSAGTILQGGTCSYAVDFTPTVSGVNSGSLVLTDNSLGSASQTVALKGTGQTITTTTVTSSANPQFFGGSVTFTATVTGSSPTGTVTFMDGGGSIGSGTLSGGIATFTTSVLAVGNHTITTGYGGDANNSGSTGVLTGNQVVSQASTTTTVNSSPNPSVFGSSVTLTAMVSPSGAGTPTGTVTFMDGSTTLGTGSPNSSGVATYTTSNLGVSSNHGIVAIYTGDANFTGSTSATWTHAVNKDTSTTSYPTSSVNPSVFGQSVTFTVTVTAGWPGSGTPTGTVTFTDGATTLGTGTTNGSGLATFTTSTLSVNNHQIVATYVGDTNFTGSTSATMQQSVNKADTATAVTSSLNASTYGQSVTFTATVSPIAPGAGTATGTVTFLDGGNSLCIASALTGGVATCTTSSLAASNHTITASYNGYANFNVSTGTLTGNPQVVNRANATVTAITFHKVYGSTYVPTGTEFTTSGFVNGDSVSRVTVASAGFASTATVVAPGPTYTNTPSAAVGTGLSNYTITYTPGTIIVDTAPLTITANSFHKLYGNLFTSVGTEFTTVGLVNGDTVASVNVTSAGFAKAATVTAPGPTYASIPSAAVGAGLNNYSITYNNGTITVDRAPLTVTATGVNKPYDGNTTATATLADDRVVGDVLTLGYSASFADKNVAVGKAVSVSGISITGGASQGNYTLANTTAAATANIVSRPLHVTANAVNKPYDGNTTGTATLADDRVVGDVLTLGYSASFADKNVAVGKAVSVSGISITGGADQGNYTLANTTAAATANIASRPLHVTANGVNKPYDGNTTGTATLADDRVAGDVLTLGYSASFADKNVAVGKAVSVSGISITGGADQGNYTLANNTAAATANITAVPLTVTASNRTKTYGQPITFAGTEFAINGLVSGDTVTSVTLTSSGAAANAAVSDSPYSIAPSAAQGTGLSNYTIAYNNGALTVNRATASVTANVANKTYGAADPTLNGALSGFLASDNVTASYSRAAGETVAGSPYTISATLSPAGVLGNYTITYNTAAFSINKAPASATATAAGKIYGAADPTLSGTLSGFLASDNVTASYSRAAGETVVGGPYTISATLNPAAVLGNYTITYNTAAFTISKANSLTTLQASAPTVMLKSNFTLTAKVTSTSGTPTGTVNFKDGATTVGTSTLDNTGTASLTLSTLLAGPHSLTAVYVNDSNFNSSTSPALSETVQDIQVTVSGSSGAVTVLSATVLPGRTATYQFQIAPTDGTAFSGTVTLSLSGLPAGATYTITPNSIAAGNGSQTINVQVLTAKEVAGLRTRGSSSPLFALGLLLPMVGIVHLRKSGAGRTKRVVFGCLLLAVAMLCMSACGGGSGFLNKAPQTYSMQLKAASGALQHTTTLNLTIQ